MSRCVSCQHYSVARTRKRTWVIFSFLLGTVAAWRTEEWEGWKLSSRRLQAPPHGSLTGDFAPFSGGQLVLFLHHRLPVRGPGHLRCRRALLPHAGVLVGAPLAPHPHAATGASSGGQGGVFRVETHNTKRIPQHGPDQLCVLSSRDPPHTDVPCPAPLGR